MLKGKKNSLKKYKFCCYFILVFLMTGIMYANFSKIVSPKFYYVANLEFEKKVNKVASDNSIIKNSGTSLNDLISVVLNDKGEILTVDYNMDKVYDVSQIITDSLITDMAESSLNQNTSFVLMLPFGTISNSVFLTNLGPKIPVLINLVDSVFTNVKTKLTNYGINNALVEVFMEISLKYEIITPVIKEEHKLDYTMLLDAKIIQGTVPDWYGSSIVMKSMGISKPI